MLRNEFTNWDDEYYVINNALLRGPDWKGIFTQSVVGNYHPLTILTLAFNYSLTTLDPSSYLLFNLLLHLLNCSLVFYFIWLISGKNIFVASFTALLFAIHPMHVESVAWVSERKDTLYTCFFLISLIKYWRYLHTDKKFNLWLCFLFFLLSLLSKPAAVVLPLVLLLLDYWKGRKMTRKVLLEKVPFFLFALLFGVITLKLQSASAIAPLNIYPLWTRFFFACYVITIYFFRFFIPYPLSTFHPFPVANHVGVWILISPIFIIGLLFFLWHYRTNKTLLFGFLFFLVNLLLVSQIVSVGLTIVSERYTYVPYIGLGFIASTLLSNYMAKSKGRALMIIPALGAPIFCVVTFQRTKIWKDSGTLWTDVLKHYPQAPMARTNRANYLEKVARDPANATEANTMLQQALEDCRIALEVDPHHIPAYENRGVIYSDLHRNKEALADGDSLIKLEPLSKQGYDIRGTAYARLNEPEKAFADFSKCISLKPDDHHSYNNRGSLLVNYYKKYPEALADFNKAIQLSPEGVYYMNRSVCYYRMGDVEKAKADAQMASQKGVTLTDDYRRMFNL